MTTRRDNRADGGWQVEGDSHLPHAAGRWSPITDYRPLWLSLLLLMGTGCRVALISAVDSLRRGTNALTPVEALQTKIALASETCSIASGPNAVAGLLLSTSLNTTLTSFDALMKRFGVGETDAASPPKTNAEPFRIQDYGQTAEKLEATARPLTELTRTLDQTIASTNLSQLAAQVAPAVQQAQTGGKAIVDYAFWKGVLLVAIALPAALIYRFLSARMTANNSPSNSP